MLSIRPFIQVHINTVYLVKLLFVRSRKQKTKVNDKSNIQGVESGDEGCGSAASLTMTTAATIIGQHPIKHNMADAYCPLGWAALQQRCFVCW